MSSGNLSKMTDIRTRNPLIVAFSAVLVLILGLSFTGTFLLLSGIKTIEDVVTQSIHKSNLVSDMRLAGRYRTLTLSQMLLMDDPFERNEEFDRFNEAGTRFVLARDALREAGFTKDEQEIIDKALPQSFQIGISQNQIVDLIQQERIEEATEIQTKNSIPIQNKNHKAYGVLQEKQRANTALAVKAALDSLRSSMYVLIIVAMIIFIVIFIMARAAVNRTTSTVQETRKKQIELEQIVQERTSELVLAKEQAEQASQTKTDFLSKMSHELRTPLNAILGFSQILQFNRDKTLSEEQLTNAAEIQSAGAHLLELINELLDLAQIESGKLELDIQPVSLSETTNEAVKMLEPLAEKQNITIINSVAEDAPEVLVDKLRLKQIMLNIIANAIKYNYKNGSVYIAIANMNEASVKLTVKDTGVGISNENNKKVFNNFERLSSQSGVEGSGIGLAVTRHLVELMDGKIGIENTTGDGCTFWVELPINAQQQSDGSIRRQQ